MYIAIPHEQFEFYSKHLAHPYQRYKSTIYYSFSNIRLKGMIQFDNLTSQILEHIMM